ncbi:MAG TPA: hypothetical protein VEZ71_11645 [Archangium sp.]|nr:hypothetical protein [Archangium sp.]
MSDSNPFLGPQPYRASERDRFFGREESTRKLVQSILAWPCILLFGPSGAGKSSLMQAGAMPLLEEKHGFRTVHVGAWLSGDAPLEWLVHAMFADLLLGPVPEGLDPYEALDEAVRRGERRSERPVLLLSGPARATLPARAFPGADGRAARGPGAAGAQPLPGTPARAAAARGLPGTIPGAAVLLE